jgi:hypothetical protein
VSDGDPWAFDPDAPPRGRHFKWGVNGQTGQLLVWEVRFNGAADAGPFHVDVLSEAWGRDPDLPADVLGGCSIAENTVRIWHFAGQPTPDEVLAWVSDSFPGLHIITPEHAE